MSFLRDFFFFFFFLYTRIYIAKRTTIRVTRATAVKKKTRVFYAENRQAAGMAWHPLLICNAMYSMYEPRRRCRERANERWEIF